MLVFLWRFGGRVSELDVEECNLLAVIAVTWAVWVWSGSLEVVFHVIL